MTTPAGPATGQVMTVFRSRLRADGADVYAEHAVRMSELARAMPGYVEHKVFTADDGERVTLVRFADRESHDAWARHPDHREAQRAGHRRLLRGVLHRGRRHRPRPLVGAGRWTAPGDPA